MGPAAEPVVLHEYRHLLRTASADWQETAHRHALWSFSPRLRSEVLVGLQAVLLAGTRLRPDDVHAVSRLIVLAERRRPRTVLDGLPAHLVEQLAIAVVSSPAGQMLAVGIDVWDGSEPPRRREDPPERDHHQRWHEQRATPGLGIDEAWYLPARASRRRERG